MTMPAIAKFFKHISAAKMDEESKVKALGGDKRLVQVFDEELAKLGYSENTEAW